MPIEPKRIEAAARAMDPRAFDPAVVGTIRFAEWRKTALKAAAKILAAAYPELASDPPTAWVAPWNATEAMIEAAAPPKDTP